MVSKLTTNDPQLTTRKRICFLITLWAVGCGLLVTTAFAETFQTNLTVGSTGPDVVSLQQFLVANGFLTMPAGVAYGYFGPLTQSAVSTWQVDTGISPAAGYFGPISRAVFGSQTAPNKIIPPISPSSPVSSPSIPLTPSSTPSSTPTPVVETDTPYGLGMRANRVMLFRAFPYEVRSGDVIEIDGSGFSRTLNKVSFNSSNSVTATSVNGTLLKITVPSLAEGEYELSVLNVLGTSDANIKVYIKVTNNPQPAPTITSASKTGDMITLVGSGFTSANDLFTTFGESSSPVSSNGTTLTFNINDLSRYNQVKQAVAGKNYQIPLWIYVQNEHGINKDPYKLDIII